VLLIPVSYRVINSRSWISISNSVLVAIIGAAVLAPPTYTEIVSSNIKTGGGAGGAGFGLVGCKHACSGATQFMMERSGIHNPEKNVIGHTHAGSKPAIMGSYIYIASSSENSDQKRSLCTVVQVATCVDVPTPSVFGRNLQCEPVRKVDAREDCHWAHA
jgi:hypothetical protein